MFKEITDESKTPDHPPQIGEIARVLLTVSFKLKLSGEKLLLSDQNNSSENVSHFL